MFKYLSMLLCFVILFSTSATSFAKKASKSETTITNNGEIPDLKKIPPILDTKYRHNKKNQFEFSPFGGSYLGTTLGQTWAAGARLYYYINNSIGFGISGLYSSLLTDKTSSFGATMKSKHMWIYNAEMQYSSDAAFMIGSKQIEMDFYATLGVGAINVSKDWEPCGVIGGGVKIYPGPSWFAIRMDVNNYAHYTPKPAEDQFDFDVTFLGGVSFLFPARPSAYEKR